MNADLQGGAAAAGSEPAVERAPLRFVSAASLFDGHDAAINMIRRLLQSRGAEVVHLGHNRSVADIVRAAIDEDADAVAVSSYQGGHNEYFAYMVDMLRERGYPHIRVIVGGGGTIAPHEIEALERHGKPQIFNTDQGAQFPSAAFTGKLEAAGIATTIDLLGETVVSQAEAEVFLQRNIDVLDTVAKAIGKG